MNRPTRLQRLLVVVIGAVVATTTTVAPAAGVAGFGDVGTGRFYTVPVQWMVDEGITTGTQPTCFSPDSVVTRGQAAAFIWRMEGMPAPGSVHPFADVSRDWQQDPVSWMDEEGITTGTSPTTFDPERALTRGEFAAFLWRLAGEPAAPAHSFGDVVLPWQQGPVSWMDDEGITTGTSPTTFSPDKQLSRAEAATFLYRFQGSPVVGVDFDHPTDPVCPQQVAGPDSTPTLTATGTIPTRPFTGEDENTKLFDAEGMAYVPPDGTIWLADDNATDEVLREVDATTGALLNSITIADLGATLQFGGGPAAGEERAGDLESVAYDAAADELYVFSGTVEGGSPSTTAFRLTRAGDTFAVESYQPLAVGADGAAARPDGSLYLVQNDISTPDDLHSYDYETNTVGAGFSIPGVGGAVWGMGFSDDGTKLFIGNDATTLYRVDWATMTIDAGFRFSLADTLGEPTAVEPIGNQVYVLDGDDSLAGDDPVKYAVHLFDLAVS